MEVKNTHIYFVFALLIRDSFGCHRTTQQSTTTLAPDNSLDYDYGQTRLRRKRHIVSSSISISMEDFFVQCMRPNMWRSKLDVRTIVRFTIKETLWYQRTDVAFCGSQDTTTCWIRLLSMYLKPNSNLLSIAAYCVHKFGQHQNFYRGIYQAPTYHIVRPLVVYYGRRRRQATNEIAVDENVITSQLRQALPRSIGDISTVIALAKEATICSPGMCDCRGVMVPNGETCGQSWYTRIVSFTRLDSGTRPAIANIMRSAIETAQRAATDSLERQRRRIFRFLLYYILHKSLYQPTVRPTVIQEPTPSFPPDISVMSTVLTPNSKTISAVPVPSDTALPGADCL